MAECPRDDRYPREPPRRTWSYETKRTVPVSSVSGSILVVCTGNAARSVMAGAFLRTHRPDLDVVTAGTLVVDGQPISWRTREALVRVGLSAPSHRSQQIERSHIDAAGLIIGLAPEHVEWVRREHSDAAWKTGTLKRLARDLGVRGSMIERLRNLRLDSVALEDWEEVVDPGGGELEDFVSCAVEVVDVLEHLVDRLDGFGPGAHDHATGDQPG